MLNMLSPVSAEHISDFATLPKACTNCRRTRRTGGTTLAMPSLLFLYGWPVDHTHCRYIAWRRQDVLNLLEVILIYSTGAVLTMILNRQHKLEALMYVRIGFGPRMRSYPGCPAAML